MLKLGVPNGSLNVRTMEILERAGFSWSKISGRKFKFSFTINPLVGEGLMMRPQSVPEAVKNNFIDCGICGLDCLAESDLENDLRTVCELPYAKNSRAGVRVVVFSKRNDLIDRKGIRVLSEYPNLTRKLFKKASISFSHGSTEQMVAYGDYDYGVGVAESGDSLRDNGLSVVDVLLNSPVVLVAKKIQKNRAAQKKAAKIDFLGRMLVGAFLSGGLKLLKFNVLDPANLPQIKKEKFWFERLTLNTLDGQGLAGEALIDQNRTVEIITRLAAVGASGIILQDINFFL
jgi:ATP phosphoribosyltransferase